LGCVVGAAAEDPHAVFEDDAAADHASGRPVRLARLDALPADAVAGVPDVAMEGLRSRGNTRNRLAAHHPNLVFENERIVQRPRAPRHRAVRVDERPAFAVFRAPDIEMIMPLVHVTADDPEPIFEDDVSRGVPAFPIPVPIKGFVEKSVWPFEPPGKAVGGAPRVVASYAQGVLLTRRLPPPQQ